MNLKNQSIYFGGKNMLKNIEQILETRHTTSIPLSVAIVGVSNKMFTRCDCWVCDCDCNCESNCACDCDCHCTYCDCD